MIAANSHKYSISAMCKVLKFPRSSYYYKETEKTVDTALENAVIYEFMLNRKNYGTRKLKKQLSRKQNGHEAFRVSRRRIRDIMRKYNLVSKYTLRRGNRRKTDVNHDTTPNVVDRNFAGRNPLEVVVSSVYARN